MYKKILFLTLSISVSGISFSGEMSADIMSKCKPEKLLLCLSNAASVNAFECILVAQTQVQVARIKRDSQSILEATKIILECGNKQEKQLSDFSEDVFIKIKGDKEKVKATKRMMFAYKAYMNGLPSNSYENEKDYNLRVKALETEFEKSQLEVKLVAE